MDMQSRLSKLLQQRKREVTLKIKAATDMGVRSLTQQCAAIRAKASADIAAVLRDTKEQQQ